MNRLSDATLNGMTKKELIEYVRMCEHNYDIAEETLRQQAENVKDWRPVKQGKWIKIDSESFYCSECDAGLSGICVSEKYISREKFCYNCGAKMEGDADDGSD